MNTYAALQQQVWQDGPYQLQPLQAEDIMPIRVWRNAQMTVLRQQAPISEAEQQAYYERVIVPTFTHAQPEQILLRFLHDGLFIGYGGLVHIDWQAKRAEVSFLLDPELAEPNPAYATHFHAYLTLLKRVAFSDLALHRLFTETYDIRPAHIATLEGCGFLLEGRLRAHMWIAGRWVDSVFHGCLSTEEA